MQPWPRSRWYPSQFWPNGLNCRTPGISRTADGKPDLKAPLPRTPYGKPDLSGLWQPDLNNPYSGNLIQDVKDETIFRPEAEAVYQKRVADFSRDSPHSRCLPEGPHQILGTGGPDHSLYRIMQSPNIVGILFEGGGFRQIFWTDGACRRVPVRRGMATRSGIGMETRWLSKATDSTTSAGSTKPGILIPRTCASRSSSGESISDTCSLRSPSTIPRCC